MRLASISIHLYISGAIELALFLFSELSIRNTINLG